MMGGWDLVSDDAPAIPMNVLVLATIARAHVAVVKNEGGTHCLGFPAVDVLAVRCEAAEENLATLRFLSVDFEAQAIGSIRCQMGVVTSDHRPGCRSNFASESLS